MSDIKFADLVGEEIAADMAEKFPDMPEDEQVAMFFVSEFCSQVHETTGMDPLDVYDKLFDGKDYSIKVTGHIGEYDVTIVFDENDIAEFAEDNSLKITKEDS